MGFLCLFCGTVLVSVAALDFYCRLLDKLACAVWCYSFRSLDF